MYVPDASLNQSSFWARQHAAPTIVRICGGGLQCAPQGVICHGPIAVPNQGTIIASTYWLVSVDLNHSTDQTSRRTQLHIAPVAEDLGSVSAKVRDVEKEEYTEVNRFTPVLAVTALALALGTTLIAVELFLERLPLAAVGTLLGGFAAEVFVWKQQSTISTLHHVRRQVAHLSSLNAAPAATPSSGAPDSPATAKPALTPPLPTVTHVPSGSPGTPVIPVTASISTPLTSDTSAPCSSDSPAPERRRPAAPRTTAPVFPAAKEPSPPAPDPSRKLRQIGAWAPRKTLPQHSRGRIDASVATDPDAAYRLFAATNGFGAPDISNVTGRTIALVGSDALTEQLAPDFVVQRLHPHLSSAELEHARPSTLVVEEDALSKGPWAGALEPQGSSLLSELLTAQAWIREHAGITYILPAAERTPCAAAPLWAEAVVIHERLTLHESGPAALMDALLRHTHREPHP